jgi:mRNA-degrading endonuclease HigB of HigAB toxin-antitoxin module
MKFLGRTEISAFIAQYPSCAEDLRVWLVELVNATWSSADALLSDCPRADASRLPTLIFYLGPKRLRIETLVDFRNGIVLLTDIGRPAATMPDHIQENWAAHRDH